MASEGTKRKHATFEDYEAWRREEDRAAYWRWEREWVEHGQQMQAWQHQQQLQAQHQHEVQAWQQHAAWQQYAWQKHWQTDQAKQINLHACTRSPFSPVDEAPRAPMAAQAAPLKLRIGSSEMSVALVQWRTPVATAAAAAAFAVEGAASKAAISAR